MFKRSVRLFTLALTLIAFTVAARTAHAQSEDPCTDPSTTCVVTGTDPQPTSPKFVGMASPNTAAADSDSTDDSQSLDDVISYLIILYGLA